MKRTLIITVFFIVFLLIYFLQTNFFNWYNIGGIKPNLFIILTLFIGLFMGKIYGFSIGILYGMCLDLFIGKRIGINAIMLALAGLIGGVLDKSFLKDNRLNFMFMSIAVTILCETINYILQIIILGADQQIIMFTKIIIIEAIYNSILVMILYPLIQKIGNRIEEIHTEKRSKALMRYY